MDLMMTFKQDPSPSRHPQEQTVLPLQHWLAPAVRPPVSSCIEITDMEWLSTAGASSLPNKHWAHHPLVVVNYRLPAASVYYVWRLAHVRSIIRFKMTARPGAVEWIHLRRRRTGTWSDSECLPSELDEEHEIVLENIDSFDPARCANKRPGMNCFRKSENEKVLKLNAFDLVDGFFIVGTNIGICLFTLTNILLQKHTRWLRNQLKCRLIDWLIDWSVEIICLSRVKR